MKKAMPKRKATKLGLVRKGKALVFVGRSSKPVTNELVIELIKKDREARIRHFLKAAKKK